MSAFFSSSEIAVFSLEDHRVETIEGHGVERSEGSGRTPRHRSRSCCYRSSTPSSPGGSTRRSRPCRGAAASSQWCSTSSAPSSGLVTAEDIVEELVGEHRRVVGLSDGRVSARGVASVGAVNTALGGRVLPGDDAQTVAGLLVEALGRPPERGERVEFDGALVTVEAVEDNHVRRVVVERRGGVGEDSCGPS
ncbi:MAG: transporter associated domain-containing protein [Haloarculaceae archaeon]